MKDAAVDCDMIETVESNGKEQDRDGNDEVDVGDDNDLVLTENQFKQLMSVQAIVNTENYYGD